jgi:hypothetical protein
MDVWVSDDGLPIVMENTLTGAAGEVRSRVELRDFGIDVHIVAPPAGDVYAVKDLSEFLDLMTKTAAGATS